MSILKLTLWLSTAMYLALKGEKLLDWIFIAIWRGIVSTLKTVAPKRNNRLFLAAQWMWWQLTRKA
jgi:hypothetical protein